jgi:hypothetical protein
MTIEIFYFTAQMQRWLNFQVARHLEAQAAKFGADGPGGSVGLDRSGMPDGCYLVDETGSIDTIHAATACAHQSAAQMAAQGSEKQTVRA